MKPLNQFSKGDRGIVAKIDGSEEIRKRMSEQGILPGVEITVFSATPGNASIIQVAGSRVMIDKDTSDNVIIDAI